MQKDLVRKEITMDGIERWQLLPNGEKMAKECLLFEQAVDSVNPSLAKRLSDGSNYADDIVLVVDEREDDHFRKRLKTLCDDENVKTEERQLPAGDYLYVQNDNVLPIIIERKTWSDLADSVNSKGRAHRRLDCVKIGSTSSRCIRGNCQLCKMKRSGCRQVIFIVEGARCRGKDSRRERDDKCTLRKRCQACKALMERHHVTQEDLEEVLHRLQAHGCFVIYTRSYNETISALFSIRDILKGGQYYANGITPAKISNEHDDGAAQTLALALGNSATAPSNLLTYNEFCANARSSSAPQIELRKKDVDILEWHCENLANFVVKSGNDWKHAIARDFLGSKSRNNFKRKRDVFNSNHNAKRKRIQENLDAICLEDSDSDNDVIEINESQETVNLLGDDSSEVHEDVIILDESQDSLQKLSPPLSPKSKADDDIIILEEDPNENGCTSSVTSINLRGERDYYASLEKSTLLVLHGWEDYEQRFATDLNRVWQSCYHDRSLSATSNNTAIAIPSTNQYKVKLQQYFDSQDDERQSSYLRRNDFMSILIWLSVRHGLNVRSIPPRNSFASALKSMWNSNNTNRQSEPCHGVSSNHHSKSSEAIVNTAAFADRVHATGKSAYSARPNSKVPLNPNNSTSQSIASPPIDRSQKSVALKQKPPLSSARTEAIAARLRRFERDGGKNPVKTDFVTRAPCSHLIPVPTAKWSCTKCTFDNDAHEVRCNICGIEKTISSAHKLHSETNHHSITTRDTASGSSMIGAPWNCAHCTLENVPDSLKCAVCQKGRPNFLVNTRATATAHVQDTSLLTSTKWKCAHCTLENEHNTLKCAVCHKAKPDEVSTHLKVPRDLGPSSHINRIELFSTTTHLGNPSPANEASLGASKRPIKCGACGLTGHNRGNATPLLCPAFNDEKEIALREAKKEKARQKAIESERDYEESKEAEENQRIREERMKRNMEEMQRDLERTREFQRKDTEQKRKTAERLRRLANKHR